MLNCCLAAVKSVYIYIYCLAGGHFRCVLFRLWDLQLGSTRKKGHLSWRARLGPKPIFYPGLFFFQEKWNEHHKKLTLPITQREANMTGGRRQANVFKGLFNRDPYIIMVDYTPNITG